MTIQNQYQKVIPFVIFILALLLLFLLVRPMITVLISSILLAYVAFPLHDRIIKKIPHKSLSIILALLIIVIIALIPFAFLVFEVTQQGFYFYNSLSNHIAKGALFGFGCTSADSKVCSLINQAERFSRQRLSGFGIDKQLQKLLPVFEEKITEFVMSIPIIMAEVFLTIVISYYILTDWENFLKRIVDFLPMRTKTVNRLTTDFGNITHTVIYAQLFVALIIGIVASIGFIIFGVPFPVILGVLLGFCTLIPTAGTSIIWIPASLYLILSGYFSNNHLILGKGIGLLLYCGLIVNYIDNFLLIRMVQAKAKVSQVIVIIGVIGGVSVFGITGIFIGPILLPLLLTYFETFKERFA
jgi:predicted PurR-regulated permease PerM